MKVELRDKTAAADPDRVLAAFALYRASGEHAWIEVAGSSMSPLVRPGDEVYVEFGGRPPRFGEIVVFREEGLMVIHRLVGRRWAKGPGTRLVTRGDGRLTFDRPFQPDLVFGVARACRRPKNGALVPVAAAGARAACVGFASAAAGTVLVGVERLPDALRGRVEHVVQRFAAAGMTRFARAVAWTERSVSAPAAGVAPAQMGPGQVPSRN
jgi:hypothetical protein